MSVRIEQLGITLPAGYAARAEGIGRGVAAELGTLAELGPLSLASLVAPTVRLEPGATDAQIVRVIARSILASARGGAEGSW